MGADGRSFYLQAGHLQGGLHTTIRSFASFASFASLLGSATMRHATIGAFYLAAT